LEGVRILKRWKGKRNSTKGSGARENIKYALIQDRREGIGEREEQKEERWKVGQDWRDRKGFGLFEIGNDAVKVR